MAAEEFEFVDERFREVINPTARVHKLFEGCAWAEGPAWSPGWRSLVWSDIPNDRQLRYDESNGTVGVFRYPAGNTNGNTVDRQGRLLSCEHGGRRISRTEFDGTVTTIVDSYKGKRLNSPNDIVVKSDDSIWFTDPAYGIESDYEGNKEEMEQDGCYVFRVDPATGDIRVVVDDFGRPERDRVLARREPPVCFGHGRHARGGRRPPHSPFHRQRRWLALRRRGLRHLHRGVLRRFSHRRRRPGLGQQRRRGACI